MQSGEIASLCVVIISTNKRLTLLFCWSLTKVIGYRSLPLGESWSENWLTHFQWSGVCMEIRSTFLNLLWGGKCALGVEDDDEQQKANKNPISSKSQCQTPPNPKSCYTSVALLFLSYLATFNRLPSTYWTIFSAPSLFYSSVLLGQAWG